MADEIIATLNLTSYDCLAEAERRECPQCLCKRKFYCYTCCVPLVEDLPQIHLPLPTHVLKCKKEPRSKSSAVPLKVLAPSDCELLDCLGGDGSIPSYPEGTYLLFPDEKAKELSELDDDTLMSIREVVFIDSTWRQTNSMLEDPSLQKLPTIKLNNHKTLFWRHQKESSSSLATVEAIYYFFADWWKEKHRRGLGEEYTGQLDNILWFFVYNYQLVQSEYTERRHKGKTFRRMPEYIKREGQSN